MKLISIIFAKPELIMAAKRSPSRISRICAFELTARGQVRILRV